MTKPKKHYLEKKVDGLNKKYSKIPDQYSELKNIYQGRDKEGKRNKKIHKLKDRYEAAEAYLQGLDSKDLVPEQRKYLIDLASMFLEYDLVLDKKRKEPEYKEAVRKKRIGHLGKTLEAMAEDEATAQPVNKTLDTYVQTPKIVTPTQSKIVTPPNPSVITTTAAGISKPSLVSRMYQSSKNAASSACNTTKGFTKKYWKYGVTFIAGAAVGSLLTYYCMTKPVTKPVPQPQKQEQIIPKQEPKKPIIKKQEPPVVKKQEPKKETPAPVIEEQKPVIKEEQITEKKKSLEESLNEIELLYGTVPIDGVDKHVIDHKASKVFGLTLRTYTEREEKIKDTLSYSLKDLYPHLVRAFEKDESIKCMHVRQSNKGIIPTLEIEFSKSSEERIIEENTGKRADKNDFYTNVGVINFNENSKDGKYVKGYETMISLGGSAQEKALKALRNMQMVLSVLHDAKFFHTYWDVRDKNNPAVEGHMVYTDKESDENFKLKGVLFMQEGTKVEVVNSDEDIRIGEEPQASSH